MATPIQIKDRLVALWAFVDGIVTSVDDYPTGDPPFEDAQLPAVVVRLLSTQLGAIQVTRTRLGSGLALERWNIPAVLHVARIEDADVLAPDTTVMETAEPFLRGPAVFFAERARLGHVDFEEPENDLSELVYDSEYLNNTGIIKIERPGVSYWGVVFNHVIFEEFTYGNA